VDQTADRIVMIGHGKVVVDAPLLQVMQSNRSRIRTPHFAQLGQALTRAQLALQQVGVDEFLVNAPLAQVSQVAYAAQVQVLRLVEEKNDLEELFFRLTD
jgi:ABC-2 type transport system ATP-binding protein